MTISVPPPGLYAITSAELCEDLARLLPAVAAALRGGAVLIQYRDKRSPPAARLANAAAALRLCHEHGARFIVNDDTALAAAIGADGVHLGASDGSLAEARARLGPAALIGASCGPSLARAQAAIAAGASYVAFGRFFDSRTKPDAPQATLELLGEARATLAVPICVIGGVTPDNASALIKRGAHWVAAVEGVFGSGTPSGIEAAARAYAELFRT